MTDIRALRSRHAFTQAGLAALIPVHASTVGRWERGKHRPRPAHADRLRELDQQDSLIASPRRPTKRRRSRPASAPTLAPRVAPIASAPSPIASGDRWSLYHGDLFDVVPTLEPASFDGLILDPPYSSGGLHIGTKQQPTGRKYQGHGVKFKHADFDGDSRDQRSFVLWLSEVLRRCYRVLKPGATFAIFSDHRQSDAVKLAVQIAGFAYRGTALWNKGEGARPQLGCFRAQCEHVLWGSKGPLAPRRGVSVLPGFLHEPVRPSDKHHLTGKPTKVMQWQAKFVIPGGRILDPCAGSGSTGVGALLEGRQFVGIEQDPHYAAVAVARLRAAAQGQILRARETRDLPALG